MVVKTNDFARFFRHNLRALFLKNTQINICELEMIKLLQRLQRSKSDHIRLTIRASNPRDKQEVYTISALPKRFKEPRITHVVRGITNLYISNFI